ncbi:MAG: aldo/keto reductase [Myxococcales bacterium]|nr:aldo/keto reductase [Myxococcales bacterium]
MTAASTQEHGPLPTMMYGTAWKEERTAGLVLLALREGFDAIDTANQRKHYFEAGVGSAVAEYLAETGRTRGELFLQSKFTYARGQGQCLPYDPRAEVGVQVAQSFASSLEHLGTSYLDSFVLHGPATGYGLTDDDVAVWRAMEELQRAGKCRFLGVSNVSLEQLRALLRASEVKPRFVQNRCFARSGWDREVRAICRAHEVVYQGFSLLTANQRELDNAEIRALAARLGGTVAQLVFRFAQAVGMLPLTGTSQAAHMREDLAASGLEISPADLRIIERLAG